MSELKVYKMRMILGKTPNYDEKGKLKNTVITPKYTGERELTDLLSDDAYKALGVCEISCVDCYDSLDVESKFPERKAEVNSSIKAVKQKAKSKVELLEEKNKQLEERNEQVMSRLEALENVKPIEAVLEVTTDSDHRDKLEAKAKELGITFSSRIGDVKLLERINEKDEDFKL